jgi:hypothetical protein
MTTRKSGLLGLALAVGLLSACESKNEIIIPPGDTVPATITVVVNPNPVNLVLGGTPASATVTATVSGSSNANVTWSISGAAATLSGQQPTSATVTAAAVGQATVTATSAANPAIRGSATVNVTSGGGTTPTPPSIVISRVTQGGTNFPVITNNVMGQIDVVATLDVPTGVAIDSITFDLDNGAIPIPNCKQTFSATGSVDLGVNAAAPVDVVCSINTAEVVNDTLGVARFLNGPHTVRARIFRPGGATTVAAVSQTLQFNNPNFVRIFSNITGSRHLSTLASMFSRGCQVSSATPGPGNLALGTQWCGGDFRVRFVPTIFNAAENRPNTYTVTMTTSGAGSSGVAGCTGIAVAPALTPNCGVTTVTKTSSAGPTVGGQVVDTLTVFNGGTITAALNDLAAVEDIVVQVTVASANTTSGLGGPACVQPDPLIGNPLVGGAPAAPVCGTGAAPAPGAVTAAPSAANFLFLQNPMRVDNLGPRVTLFDFTPATMGCTQSACFINGNFTFTERAGFFTTVDYGVDGQTVAFTAGPQTGFPTGSVANVTSGAQLPETGTPSWVVQAVSTDKLQNATTVFAGPVATTPVTTSAAAQPIGIDKTNPRVLSVAGVARNGTDNDEVVNTVTVTFVDTAVAPAGPSGFPATPLATTSVQRINAAGTTAVALGAAVACAGTSCTFGMPEATSSATSGYFRVIFTVRDAAFSGPGTPNQVTDTLIYLDDEAPPTVAGVTAPSTIVGSASVTFTADATENVELGDVIPSISYGNSATDFYAHNGMQTIGSYGISPLDFDRSSATAAAGDALAVTMNPFIYSLEFVSAAHAPLGNASFANAVNFAVRDVAGVQLNVTCPAPAAGDGAIGEVAPPANRSNCIQRQNNNIAVNVAAGSTLTNYNTATLTPGPAQSITTFMQLAPVRTATTITLTAQATGPQGTFANPFPNGVNFYRQDPTQNNRWIFVGTSTTAVATDDDVQAVRRWTYSLTVPNASVPAPQVTRAMGLNAGRGLIAQASDQTAF